MTRWSNPMRAAIKFMEDVEQCMVENCIKLEVNWTPFMTNGRRSEGVTACFSNNKGSYFYISIYEHWNSDHINLKFEEYPKFANVQGHDEPTIQLNSDQQQVAAALIQMFLMVWFDEDRKELYVPSNDYCGIEDADEELKYKADNLLSEIMPDFFSPCDECGVLYITSNGKGELDCGCKKEDV